MDSFNYCHCVLIHVCGAFDCIVEGGVVRWSLFCVLCVFLCGFLMVVRWWHGGGSGDGGGLNG